jgi:hypothetical protein
VGEGSGEFVGGAGYSRQDECGLVVFPAELISYETVGMCKMISLKLHSCFFSFSFFLFFF